MKKLLLACLVALPLAACASMPNPFTSIANPLGTTQLGTIESAYGVALSAAVAYHDVCVKRIIPPSCRPIVLQLQQKARLVQGAIVAARGVAKNPTLDAVSAIATAQQALNDFQNFQAANGVK